MGLFVTHDGHLKQPLAAILCCFAAVTEDEYPMANDPLHPFTTHQNLTCDEQPLPLTHLPVKLPSLVSSTSAHTVQVHDFDKLTRTPSERPPSLKPLDLGDSSLLGRGSQHLRGNSVVRGLPPAARRLDRGEVHRQSLVPLRLGPVVLRGNPEPTLVEEAIAVSPQDDANPISTPLSMSQADLGVKSALPCPERAGRDTPSERCLRRSAPASRNHEPVVAATSGPHPDVFTHPAIFDKQHVAPTDDHTQTAVSTTPRTNLNNHPDLPSNATKDISRLTKGSSSRQSSSSSLRRDVNDPSRNSSLTSRPSSERLPGGGVKRKSSFPKRTGSTGDALDIDKEILELNTIVEERRAEAGRATTSHQHVPAIAPNMNIGARSETLDAIGSALSRPYTPGSTKSAQRTHDGNAASIPPPPQPPSDSRPHMRRSSSATSRVSGWLSGIFPSTTPGSHANASEDTCTNLSTPTTVTSSTANLKQPSSHAGQTSNTSLSTTKLTLHTEDMDPAPPSSSSPSLTTAASSPATSPVTSGPPTHTRTDSSSRLTAQYSWMPSIQSATVWGLDRAFASAQQLSRKQSPDFNMAQQAGQRSREETWERERGRAYWDEDMLGQDAVGVAL